MSENIDPKLQQLADDYLLGRMDPDARGEFERRMDAEPEVADAVEQTRRIRDAVVELKKKRILMAEWERNYALDKKFRSIRRRRRLIVGSSVAAMLVVVLGIAINWLSPPRPGTYDVKGTFPEKEVVFRGGGPDEYIARLIKEGKEQQALAAIDSALDDMQIDSLLPAEEVQYQKQLAKDRTYELTWLKIQALHRSGRDEEAEALLKDFCTKPGKYHDDAVGLYLHLKKNR